MNALSPAAVRKFGRQMSVAVFPAIFTVVLAATIILTMAIDVRHAVSPNLELSDLTIEKIWSEVDSGKTPQERPPATTRSSDLSGERQAGFYQDMDNATREINKIIGSLSSNLRSVPQSEFALPAVPLSSDSGDPQDETSLLPERIRQLRESLDRYSGAHPESKSEIDKFRQAFDPAIGPTMEAFRQAKGKWVATLDEGKSRPTENDDAVAAHRHAYAKVQEFRAFATAGIGEAVLMPTLTLDLILVMLASVLGGISHIWYDALVGHKPTLLGDGARRLALGVLVALVLGYMAQFYYSDTPEKLSSYLVWLLGFAAGFMPEIVIARLRKAVSGNAQTANELGRHDATATSSST